MNYAKKWWTFENYCTQIGHDPMLPKGEVTEALWRAFMHFNQGIDLEDIPRLRPHHEVLYCTVNGQAGRYVPQRFAERYAVPDDDRAILLDGPDTDLYWLVWDDVLRDFKVEDEDFGTEVFFYERDGDVFAVRDDISEIESFIYLEG
jgi:hypothetical protein